MALSDDPRTDPFNFLKQLNQNSADNTAFVTQAAARRRSMMNRLNSMAAPTQQQQSMPQAGGSLQQYAQSQLGRYGWGADQWDALNKIFTQESGWNPNAVNPSSGAWGIAQILPSAHPDVPRNLSGQQQVDWGLNYIKGRYGDPANAWNFHLQNNWY